MFGVGGHGRVVADATLLQGQWSRVMASYRSLPTHSNELLPDVDLVDLQAPIHREAALHIGNNTARQIEAQALDLHGW